jgi:hypothetical protein
MDILLRAFCVALPYQRELVALVIVRDGLVRQRLKN